MNKECTIKLKEEESIMMLHILDEYLQKDRNDTLVDISNKIYKAKQKPYTNFDKIKDEMTIEELTKIVYNNQNKYNIAFPYDCCGLCDNPTDEDCIICARKWLESEVKE